MNIIFTDTIGVPEEYCVTPSIKSIPNWYKNTPSYVNNKKQILGYENPKPSSTIKKCMPVFDAMTAGYIIKTYVDISVSIKDGGQYFQWPAFNPIQFHAIEQVSSHPKASKLLSIPKFINAWSVSTPRGYSCLFLPPMHNSNSIFEIFPGIVDTDNHHAPVHFPFTMKDPLWEGIIEAGTPIAQVIPFKRDSFKMKFGGKKDIEKSNKTIDRITSTWFNYYKKNLWNKKQYL